MDGNDSDLRDQIVELEAKIEKQAAAIENCRKVIVFSRAAIAGGAIVLVAMTFGAMAFNPMIFIAAVAAVLGGIVLLGSTMSTSEQAAAALRGAEARRAELIAGIDLRLIGERPALTNGKGVH